MGKRKMEMIEAIVTMLKPNTYTDARPEWIDLQSGLLRMSLRELGALYHILLCQRPEVK